MNITEITKRAGKDRKPRRVGRGRASGCGKTSGRGHKGGGQRAGWTQRGMQEGGQMPTFRRIPKRGFSNAKFRIEYAIVNVSELEARFDADAHVTPQALHTFRLVSGKGRPVKVLGNGNLTKRLRVDAAAFSKSALEKIKAAGGEAKVV